MKIETAIHCLKVKADEEVCEECELYSCTDIQQADIARLAISALEKQIPMKATEVNNDFCYFQCGNCGDLIIAENGVQEHKYCLNCGQAIGWGDSD